MFQQSIKNIKDWFCEFTNFKELPNEAFDDRHVDSGYFISETDSLTDFNNQENNLYAVGSKRFDIYIQYRKELTYDLISGLLSIFSCSGEQVIRVNTDSKEIYEEVQNNKFTDNEFYFAKITVELKGVLRPKNCKIC